MTHQKIKIFQTVRQNLESINFGIDKHWFDLELLISIFKSFLALSLQFIYLFFVADTPEELMNSIFMTVAGTLVFMSFLSIVSKMADIFYLMDRLEKVVNKSELTN